MALTASYKKEIETVIRSKILQSYKSYTFYKDDPFNLTLLDEYYKIIVK